MKTITAIFSFSILLGLSQLMAQTGIIKGKVYNQMNNESIPFANVIIKNTTIGSTTNEEGFYEIRNIEPGFYNIMVSYVGYETKTVYEIEVFNSKPTIVNIPMKATTINIDEVVVTTELFSRTEETPLSIKSLGVAEIQRSPGGGRDISRVVQTLPGVASSPASNRNDIIIRGGGPSENRFYIDGFEINAINHFTTQGASGGVWGTIDANQLKQLDLITGAFPAKAGNALSSVFDIKLKEGNSEKFDAQFSIGVLQRGLNINGYIGSNTTFLAGVRQANFDLLFSSRPIVPKFSDFIFKSVTNFDERNKLELFGFGAIDDLNINTDVEKTDHNLFTLERARRIQQYTYTAGVKWTKFWDNGFTNIIISRNVLNNDIVKHRDNNPAKELLLDYDSNEAENKLNLTNEFLFDGFRFGFGLNYELATFTASSHYFRVNSNGSSELFFDSELDIYKYGFYLNGSTNLFDEKLSLSFGVRTDANNYSDEFSNPLAQMSPRVSLSYSIIKNLKLNANFGIYYQNPPYMSLGFVENNILINKENKITPIKSTHYIVGLEYLTNINSSVTVEGFYKKYDNYPFSVNDQISLANKGAGFGVYGAEELTSTTQGQSYGLEFMYQQKLFKGFYGILSYTFVKSEFTNADDNYTSSSWDYGNILSTTFGKRFGNGFEVGVKWVYYGGVPYTPYNIEASSVKENWDTKGRGVLDYSQLNGMRADSYHQLDIRIDKKFYFDNFNLTLFADIQNVYDYVGGLAPDLILDRDEDFEKQTDPQNPNLYLTKYAEPEGFGIRPNLGFIIEF